MISTNTVSALTDSKNAKASAWESPKEESALQQTIATQISIATKEFVLYSSSRMINVKMMLNVEGD